MYLGFCKLIFSFAFYLYLKIKINSKQPDNQKFLPQEYPKPSIEGLGHDNKAPIHYGWYLKENRLQPPIAKPGLRASIIMNNILWLVIVKKSYLALLKEEKTWYLRPLRHLRPENHDEICEGLLCTSYSIHSLGWINSSPVYSFSYLLLCQINYKADEKKYALIQTAVSLKFIWVIPHYEA